MKMIVWLILQLLENCRQVYLLLWAFQDFTFTLIISWLFQGARKDKPSNTQTLVLVDLRRPNIGREFFPSALNLKDIPCNDDFRETLDRVHVKYVLPTGALCPKSLPPMSKKWANLAKRWLFISAFQDTNVIVGLRLLTTGTNVTTVFCAQGRNKSGLKLARMENTYMPAPFKTKPEYCDINIVLLQISAK